MEQTVRLKNIGLRGVKVADTKISYIDGEEGVLIYRGYRIEDLAEKSSFEEIVYLLLNGHLPKEKELKSFKEELVASRRLPAFINESYTRWPKQADPMDVLQASVPLLAMADTEGKSDSRAVNVRRAIKIIGAFPAILAGWHRTRNGQRLVPPDENLSHAANFLWQLNEQVPDEDLARDLDVCLILHAEHTFNASTFACREVVSTRASMYGGVAAGVGALSGIWHGGANARVTEVVLRMASARMSRRDVAAWVRDQLARGERIMGMGHAVYKTFDPRAVILKRLCYRLAKRSGQEHWHKLLGWMEEESLKQLEKKGLSNIKPNVDFYSGLIYAMMGIPLDLMTTVFAAAIVSGWCAHIIEEKFAEAQEKPVLYRPEAEYVGDYCGEIGCIYHPIDKR